MGWRGAGRGMVGLRTLTQKFYMLDVLDVLAFALAEAVVYVGYVVIFGTADRMKILILQLHMVDVLVGFMTGVLWLRVMRPCTECEKKSLAPPSEAV